MGFPVLYALWTFVMFLFALWMMCSLLAKSASMISHNTSLTDETSPEPSFNIEEELDWWMNLSIELIIS